MASVYRLRPECSWAYFRPAKIIFYTGHGSPAKNSKGQASVFGLCVACKKTPSPLLAPLPTLHCLPRVLLTHWWGADRHGALKALMWPQAQSPGHICLPWCSALQQRLDALLCKTLRIWSVNAPCAVKFSPMSNWHGVNCNGKLNF